MSLRIDVGDGTLDLLPNAEQDFYVTKQVHDLHDLETREGDFTKTIIAPYSNNNLLLLSVETPQFTRHSTRGTRFIPCQLFIDGISILNGPVLRIEKGDEQGFTLTIFAGVVGFFLRLPEENISELDWSDLNFDWTIANLNARRNNATGLVYPHSIWMDNASYRKYAFDGGEIALDGVEHNSLPNSGFYIYFREVIDRIMASAAMEGLTVDYGDLESDVTFNTAAFSNPMNLLRSGYKTSAAGYTGASSAPVLLQIPVNSDFKSLLVASLTVNIAMSNNEWVIAEAGDCNILLRIQATVELGATLTFSIMRNDSLVSARTLLGGRDQQNEVIEISTPLNLNDRVWARITTAGPSGFDAAFSVSVVLNVNKTGPSGAFIVANYLPEISQLNFVKSVLAMFNMVATEKNNVISFTAWDKIPAAAPIEIDYDPSKNFTESGIFAGYAARNFLKYSTNNVIERSDFDGSFSVNVAGIDQEETKIQLPFHATDDTEIDGGQRVSIPAYKIERITVNDNIIVINTDTSYLAAQNTDLKVGDIITFNPQAPKRYRVRIVTDKKAGFVDSTAVSGQGSSSANWAFMRFTESNAPALQLALMSQQNGDFIIRDGDNITTTAGDYKRALFAPQLSFSFLIDTYFKNLIASMVSPFTLVAWFNIDILQFIEIDQLRPFYLASYGANFYVNKIEQYKTRGLVRIELLQVGANTQVVADSEGLQVGAFDDSFSNDFDNYDVNEI